MRNQRKSGGTDDQEGADNTAYSSDETDEWDVERKGSDEDEFS